MVLQITIVCHWITKVQVIPQKVPNLCMEISQWEKVAGPPCSSASHPILLPGPTPNVPGWHLFVQSLVTVHLVSPFFRSLPETGSVDKTNMPRLPLLTFFNNQITHNSLLPLIGQQWFSVPSDWLARNQGVKRYSNDINKNIIFFNVWNHKKAV